MIKYRILMAGIGILVFAVAADAQFPGGAGQPGGGGMGRGGPGGGRGGMGGDPMMFFNMLSGGKDVIVKDNLADDRQRMMFDGMAKRMGITTGQITREQYSESVKQMVGGGGGPPSAAPGGVRQMGPGGSDASGGGAEGIAESSFRRADKNNDGVLQAEEMPEALLAEKEKWDKNQDGVIDLTEYKAFVAARRAAVNEERNKNNPFGPGNPNEEDEEEEHRPTVYRSGKLPKDLPAWFAQLDKDADMQIGLYEWKNSGRSIKEFRDMDRNGDNFLTVDEVLFYVRSHNPAANGTMMASAAGPGAPAGMAGMGGFGGGMAPGGMKIQLSGGFQGFMPQGNGNGGPGMGRQGRQPGGNGPGGPGGDPNGGGRGNRGTRGGNGMPGANPADSSGGQPGGNGGRQRGGNRGGGGAPGGNGGYGTGNGIQREIDDEIDN